MTFVIVLAVFGAVVAVRFVMKAIDKGFGLLHQRGNISAAKAEQRRVRALVEQERIRAGLGTKQHLDAPQRPPSPPHMDS